MKKTILAILFAVVLATTIQTAYAAEEGVILTIFSSETFILAFAIASIGIGLKAVYARWSAKDKFDPRVTGATLIVSYLIALQMVATSIEHLPADATATTYLTILVGEILAVMGIDSAAKRVGQKIKGKIPGGSGE